MYIIQQLMNGICQGSIYALMAIGYALIFGVVGLVTFTYGEVIMLGSFSAFYYFIIFGDNLLFALICGFISAAVVGILVHKVCYERFLNAPRYISLICTIGMSMFLKNLAIIVFGSTMKGLPRFFEDKNIVFMEKVVNGNITRVSMTYLQLMVLCTVVVLAISLSLFLNKTKMGMRLRAVSQDRKAAALVGINVKRTTLLGNCIGCGLGGVAGILLGLYYNSVIPTMGGVAGLKAFSSVVIGGLSNITGAALGGLSIGIIENMGIAFIPNGSGYRDVFAFAFLVIVLSIMPEGLFAKRGNKV
ncbi:branched-chain amino acid ABC transporter permease [Vallitalea maricola]|uniref:Branched-chain amino acid ABC transporter permease n=1 Tax=Vallitalea maricola TaxID=3074433 RepID=A0ACB5URX6_9FIRM|nr:branched-chain amino acid ABC transporter permease [Vallitalea sp. AN17-2]